MAEQNEIAGPAPAHSPRRIITPVMHANGHTLDMERTIIECEAPDCQKQVSLADSFSFVVTLATTGPAGRHAASGTSYRVGAFQCVQEQHFCCSPACAIHAAALCMAHQASDLTRRHAAIQAHYDAAAAAAAASEAASPG